MSTKVTEIAGENTDDEVRELVQAIGAAQERLLAAAIVLHGGRGLSAPLRGVLLCIEANGPQGISRLAELCRVSRQFLQRSVQALTAGEWVEARPNPRHKGSPLIVLTRRGIDEVARIHTLEAPHLRRIAERISPRELASALRVLSIVGLSPV